MSNLRSVVGGALGAAAAAKENEAYFRDLGRDAGLAWALGHNTLYKFKSFQAGVERDRVFDMLGRARVYLSSPDQFNDPFDSAPVVALDGDPDDPEFILRLEALENKRMKDSGLSDAAIAEQRAELGTDVRVLPDLVAGQIREHLRSTTRILCLSSEQQHPMQWSHYADQHRGLCIHYSVARGQTLGLARHVVYRDDRNPLLLPLESHTNAEIMERLVLAKAKYWEYEHEFRIVVVEDDPALKLNDNFLVHPREAIVGVTIGMRMPPGDERALIQFMDSNLPSVPIWKAAENRTRYWMDIHRVR